MKLFIGNLAWEVTSDDLRDLFSQAGTVTDAVVLMDKMTGRSRGFGFVEFANAEEAKAAIEKFNLYDLKGRKLNVNEARPMQPRQ